MVFTYFGSEPDILRRLVARLMREEERAEYDRLLKEEHFLHDPILVGQALRYVAEIDGQWVALITFSAASLHLKAREKWIGWSPRQRTRRLAMVVNNSRLLVRPERQRYPNLASRALALCLQRLSQDWQERWKHPVMLVESFVDESQYRGTCYRACGFSAVGPTRGFARASRDFYLPHGQPKQLYLRELRPGARKVLRQARWPAELAEHEAVQAGPCPFRAPVLENLLDQFGRRSDPRRGHGLRHRQRFVLACAAVSTLMGACGYRAFENTCVKFTQRQLRALGCQPTENGIYVSPSDSTFQRVLKNIDPRWFASIIGTWLLEQEIGALARLAVDGKVLRGSGRHDGKPLQLLSAVTHQLRLTLEQIPIEEKSNEIPAFKPLLEKLNLPPGTLVTADALHCQQESARYVTQDIGGDYLFGLKGNQAGVLEKAERLLAQQAFPPEAMAKWEKVHGRLNRWRIKRVAVTPEEIGLCGCWQVIAVERARIELTKPAKKAKTDPEEKPAKETKPAAAQKPVTQRKATHETSVEISCYATSLSLEEHDGAALEEIIRGHWSAIENGTHYRRDVTLGEDACRTANWRGAEVLASLRNLALGIYELQRARQKTKVDTLASWCEQQTFSKAWLALRQ